MDGQLALWQPEAFPSLPAPLAPIEELAQEARIHAANARSENTLRAYAADWRDFLSWCQARGVTALPATEATLCLYFTERARTLKVNSLGRRLAAISVAHNDGGFEDLNPTRSAPFRRLWRGIRRSKGTAVAKKAPLLTDDLRRVVEALPARSLRGLRDRALLLIGFAGALRRSELVGLNLDDLRFVREGLVLTLRHSKTDQEGDGAAVPIPYGSNPETCPVRAMQQWLETAGIARGPAFRPISRWGRVGAARLSGDAIPHIVRKGARTCGLDAAALGGHSLRAGFASTAAARDVSERDAMTHMRQKSVAVHRGYVRAAGLFKRNPAAQLRL